MLAVGVEAQPLAAAAPATSADGAGGVGAGVPRRADVEAEGSAAPLGTPRVFDGTYILTLHNRWVGPVRGRFDFEPLERVSVGGQPARAGFKANTRPDVAWSLVGGLEGALGRVLAPFLFPSGMILTWQSTTPTADAPGEGTIGVGTLSQLRVRTRIASPGAPVEIVLRDGRVVAKLTFEPAPRGEGRADGVVAGTGAATGVGAEGDPATAGKPNDYRGLVERAAAALPDLLYDPSLAESGPYRTYIADLRQAAESARDDVEFLFAGALAARKSLRFSIPFVYRQADPGVTARLFPPPAPGQTDEGARPFSVRRDEATGVRTLRIDAIVEPTLMTAALSEALAEPAPAGLIIDLRTCAGVDLTWTLLASGLSDAAAGGVVGARASEGGLVFGAGARATALRDGLGSAQEPEAIGDAETLAAAQAMLREPGATRPVRVRIRPAANAYRGPVVVMTSRRTSSAAEQFVYWLKATGRATLVGEATTGRPFITDERSIGEGWMLRVAAYDYRPVVVGADGVATVGAALSAEASVTPDVSSSRDGSPARAARIMAEKLERAKRESAAKP